MIFNRKCSIANYFAVFVLLLLVACEEDLNTLGEGVVGGEPFTSDRVDYDVFVTNQRLLAVQTNRLPLYQLGTFNDPIYGRSEAKITSQLRLSTTNPIFGNFSQSTEDAADTDDLDETIDEMETVTEVILYIPYQLASPEFRDKDNDGVPVNDDFDDNDRESDSDGDGVSDGDETAIGSDPLDPAVTGEEDDFEPNRFPQTFAIDSIFASDPLKPLGEIPFNVRVDESTFFLADLDPNSNFTEAQEYFSNSDLTTEFSGQRLDIEMENQVVITNQEFFELTEDDLDTEENEFNIERQNPGIRIPLNVAFFQENILNKEGSSELLTQSNFNSFLRGLHFSIDALGEDLLLLLDLTQATITINYTFLDVPSTSDTDGDDATEPEIVESSYVLNLVQLNNGLVFGNAVNTILNPNFPNNLDYTSSNAERIYLKGGPGSVAEIRLFDMEDGQSIIDEIRANNWIINEANLEFYVDRETLDMAQVAYEPPRLYLFNAETNAPIFNANTESNSAETPLGAFLNYDGILERDGDSGIKYTVRLTEYLNDIIVRDSANVPLKLAVSSDIRVVAVQESLAEGSDTNPEIPIMSTINPFGTVLFGGNVGPENEDRKLKLRLFYTEAN
ncbi:DUF4270 family protein [Croceivirga thetidis]|uniref:DUF4270 domain-containing protein n=1 Tax=Croceivirga thetidis TaxID=2721623 RepID=A0ABX1GRD0_9FLAO|nr:DUF4270 family protein [Croceivirga thetidis]NKI31485.1 DUF4270 domain-containing protein [Croceivirga thetidis]